MSASAALLRLLLSLVLVLNGIGSVAASARMAGAMDGAHHAAVSKPAAAKHCAQSAMAEATADPHAGHDSHATAPPCSDHAKPDCCDSSACGCACAQSGSTALFAVAQLSPVFLHGHLAPPPSAGHVAPALAFPTRPPIA
ncbi:CopL family metal-binding regulatory protein [Dokdonella sp.]|uniref:CopL family metal-binding regulatory protein n=1 Tax=Dokdonella sp. TaxID=2291710 RepID=UPI001B02EDA5|nr:CopL family metal-binding regulatory protein [Dokdonella sp.]MBO9662180.1 CopL family metal-binding regulatory protein [Dokdonella sp.]